VDLPDFHKATAPLIYGIKPSTKWGQASSTADRMIKTNGSMQTKKAAWLSGGWP
jgi:hypothetical protein